jgi:serine/threonine-protein kinase
MTASPERLAEALSGRYVIERELGRGGMATVYLARDVRHDRGVAIKVLRPELAAAIGPGRFLREIHLAAGFSHPHILPVFDSGDADGLLWYAMPYVEGESLRDRLDREQMLGLDEALQIGGEIAGALQYAHERGVIHRDIKPDNIMLSQGHALLADLGIAKMIGGQTDRLTETGLSLGTPAYMSPEQSAGDDRVDARSDQYSLACVVYEMLAGEPPYTGPTAQAIIARRLTETPRPLKVVRETIPESVERAVSRGLARAPVDRFPTISAFASALRDARPFSERRAAPSRRIWVVAAAVLVVVCGLLAISRLWMLVSPLAPAPTTEGHPKESTGLDRTRIAVFPFTSVSADPDDASLADGISEELVSALSRVTGLHVLARRAVVPYQDKSLSLIADSLSAGTVVEGSLLRRDARVAVRVRLVDVGSQETVWEDTIERPQAELAGIPATVARRVADSLRIRLGAAEARQLSRLPTTNARAYEYLLRGRYFDTFQYAQLPRDSLMRLGDSAVAMYQRATELDPGFAVAYAHLARACNYLVFANLDPRARQTGFVALQRALELDSTLDLAYLARAALAYTREGGWRYLDAMRDDLRAIRLNPGSVGAHDQLGSLYMHLGLHEEALAELRTSLSLDPNNGFAPYRVARTLWFMGRYADALEAFRRDPNDRWETALPLQHLGRLGQAATFLTESEGKVRQTTGRSSEDITSTWAVVLAAQGKRKEAEAKLKEAMALSAQSASHFHHSAYNIAAAYALLGERAAAVEWLTRTAEDGMPDYPLFLSDPNLQSLHQDSAYLALMDRMKSQHELFVQTRREASGGS